MPERKPSCVSVILILLVIAFCLATAGAALAGIALPARASQVFGPPAENLGLVNEILLSGRLLLATNDLTLPADPYGEEQSFTIDLGESAVAVASRLEQAGLVTDGDAFRHYLVYSGLDTTLQAGEYRLSPRLNAVEIAQALQDATPDKVRFAILPGWRLEEIARSLPTSGLNISPETFLAEAASFPDLISFSTDIPASASLEGFLLPDLYELERTLDAGQIISIFLLNFREKVGPELRQGFERQGLTLYEAVTLASIVEREAITPEEMPLIASVFYNRLRAGMKLDSDPTVQYAVGYSAAQDSWWVNPLSAADLQTDSPYNTYLYPGLPPGPIANPSLEALRAVAFPAQSPYYYFRASCSDPSRHDFSETYNEHLEKDCR